MEIKLSLINDSYNSHFTEDITLYKGNVHRVETHSVTSWQETITIELGDRRVTVNKSDLIKAISVL